MKLKVAGLIAVLVAAAASLVAFPHLPAEVPMHWNLSGQVDRYGSRLEAVIFGPLLTLGVYLLALVTGRIDPKVRAGEDDPSPRRFLLGVAVLLVAGLHLAILGAAAGLYTDVSRALAVVLALFLAVAGNQMTRVRPNWFAGIRTPWTLSSETVWRRTHRLAGHLMVGAGVLSLAGIFLVPSRLALVVVTALTLLATLAPAVWSWALWRREQTARS